MGKNSVGPKVLEKPDTCIQSNEAGPLTSHHKPLLKTKGEPNSKSQIQEAPKETKGTMPMADQATRMYR